MVSFRGTHRPISEYVKGKPRPWGFTIGTAVLPLKSSVIVQPMKVALEQKPCLALEVMLRSSCVKLSHQAKTTKYLQTIFFSSAPLLFKLLQRQIYCVGILRNRLAVCQLEDENNLAKRKRKRICWFKSGERGQYGHSLVVRQQICCPDLILLCSWAPGWSSMLEQIRQGIWWGQQATHCEGVQHIHEWGRLPWCMRCKVQLPHEFPEGVSLPVRINRHVRPC